MTTITKDTIAQIAGNNPKVIAGINALLNENVIFRSFDRALNLLLNARSEHYLRAVEAGLQVTVNEIKNYHVQHSPYITDDKAALYLYTLQHLITHLGQWEFKNGEPNHYKPILTQKLRYVELKGASLGIRKDMIRRECFSKAYQQPNDQVLSNFEFLDEQRLDTFTNRLNRYEITQDPCNLFESNKNFQTLLKTISSPNYIHIMEKLIQHLKESLEIMELDLTYLKQNVQTVSKEVGKYIGSNDPQKIESINKAILRHLENSQPIELGD